MLLRGVAPEQLKALTLLRLLRTVKFRQAIAELESQMAAFGFIRLVNWSTILQCVSFILGVNHALACITFYVGRQEQQRRSRNWIDENGVDVLHWRFQYMCRGMPRLCHHCFFLSFSFNQI